MKATQLLSDRAPQKLFVCFGFMLAFLTTAYVEPAGARPATAAVSQGMGTRSTAMTNFTRAWQALSAYSATVTLFERKGARTQRAVYDYTFAKPTSVTLHVVSGASAGDTLVWNGGTTVVAHRGSGLLSALKKTFSLHDPLTTTIRGSSVDELSFGAILTHARQSSGRLTSGLGAASNGAANEAITFVPNHASNDAGFTREVVAASTTSHLPVRVLGYDATGLVREIDFSNVDLRQGT